MIIRRRIANIFHFYLFHFGERIETHFISIKIIINYLWFFFVDGGHGNRLNPIRIWNREKRKKKKGWKEKKKRERERKREFLFGIRGKKKFGQKFLGFPRSTFGGCVFPLWQWGSKDRWKQWMNGSLPPSLPSWSQGVVWPSKPRKYPRSGYFLVCYYHNSKQHTN